MDLTNILAVMGDSGGEMSLNQREHLVTPREKSLKNSR